MADGTLFHPEDEYRRVKELLTERELRIWDIVTTGSRLGQLSAALRFLLLEIRAHVLLTGPRMAAFLNDPLALRGKGLIVRANVARMRHLERHARATSLKHIIARTRLVFRCELAWRKARRANDFSIVAPALDALVADTRKLGEAKARALGIDNPYEALIDEFAPGRRLKHIDPLFSAVAEFSTRMLPEMQARQMAWKAAPPDLWAMPVEIQKQLALRILARCGFDFSNGKLGESAHPLCLGAGGKVRLSLRYDERDFVPMMLDALHECGHALYRQGLPPAWWDQPVGSIPSQTLDEAISLLLENHVGRSAAFARWVVDTLEGDLDWRRPGLDAQTLLRRLRRIHPSAIRTEADEVTYPLHVILRHGLGRRMVEGSLATRDLPAAWNAEKQRLLGIVAVDDRNGCLQDIHWYGGQFGYFPSYLKGMLAAAQLAETALAADPAIGAALGHADPGPLLAWLEKHVFRSAALVSSRALMRRVTGRGLEARAFIEHIHARYIDGEDFGHPTRRGRPWHPFTRKLRPWPAAQ